MKEIKDMGLNFVSLDLSSTRLVLPSHASFANPKESKSKVGFVLILADDNGNAKIVHYGSSR